MKDPVRAQILHRNLINEVDNFQLQIDELQRQIEDNVVDAQHVKHAKRAAPQHEFFKIEAQRFAHQDFDARVSDQWELVTPSKKTKEDESDATNQI